MCSSPLALLVIACYSLMLKVNNALQQSSTRAAPSGGISKTAAPKAGAKKLAAGKEAADSGPADNDDAALSGGSLSDTELKERMQALLGDEIYNGLLVYFWAQFRTTNSQPAVKKHRIRLQKHYKSQTLSHQCLSAQRKSSHLEVVVDTASGYSMNDFYYKLTFVIPTSVPVNTSSVELCLCNHKSLICPVWDGLSNWNLVENKVWPSLKAQLHLITIHGIFPEHRMLSGRRGLQAWRRSLSL